MSARRFVRIRFVLCVVALNVSVALASCTAPLQLVQPEPAATSEAPPSEEAVPAAESTPESQAAGAFCLDGDLLTFGAECINGGASPYDADQRASACADIWDFDEDAAFDATAATGDLIAWTFGVNFDVLNAAGSPLGCLHLYARDEANTTFVPVDAGGILVDTCAATASPVYDFTGEDNSAGLPSTMAMFDGTQAVVCQMDLGAWMLSSQTLAIAQSQWTLPFDAGQALTDSVPNDLLKFYSNLSLIARPLWPNPVTCDPDAMQDDACAQPLFGVWLPWEPPEPLHTLEVFAENVETFRFWSALDCPDLRAWPWDAETWFLVWRFAPALDSQGDPDILDLEYLADPSGFDTACFAADVFEKIPYYLGASNLWIGWDPLWNVGIQGNLDGVLIDPSDSKPPS